MIHGIGIDIVKISRIAAWEGKPGLMERYFHPNEIMAARKKGSSYFQSLAARFAAKEALGKAFGTGLTGLRLKDIEIFNLEDGRPEVRLHGSVLDRSLRRGIKNVFISLTHEEDNAVAKVVLEV